MKAAEVYYDEIIDRVALQTQREIKKIYIDIERNCRVVPATPNGSCGFHSISETLRVLGYLELASQISRNAFIKFCE